MFSHTIPVDVQFPLGFEIEISLLTQFVIDENPLSDNVLLVTLGSIIPETRPKNTKQRVYETGHL